MGNAVIIDLSGDLDWVEFDIPGGSEPVRLARLRDDDGAPTALVHFPDGWHRAIDGAYLCAEEFTVLRGTLHMSGRAYAAPHWVFAPANFRRTDTHMEPSVLAVARFDDRARWRDGAGDDVVEATDAAVDGPARRLLSERGTVTRLVDDVDAAAAEVTTELLSPAAMTWAWIPAGETMPALPGPVIMRTIVEDR